MNKLIPLLMSVVLFFGCTTEDSLNPPGQGLQVNADFLKLSDSGGTTAGNIVINADVPEVTLRWNTNSLCNLDTNQTKLKLSKGSATLAVKWLGKLGNGAYGPEGVAFKAGVQIVAGEKSQYVPLVWADKIDSTEVLNSAIQTRSAGDVMPRVAQITMIPTTVNMNDQNGGSMYIGLTDVPFAIFDMSEFTSDMNIDMSKIPYYITTSQMLDFKWTAAGAPTFGFSARIIAMTDGLTQYGIVTFGSSTPSQDTVTLCAAPGGTVSSTGGSGSENQVVSSIATPNTEYTAVNSCKDCPTEDDLNIILGQGDYWLNRLQSDTYALCLSFQSNRASISNGYGFSGNSVWQL